LTGLDPSHEAAARETLSQTSAQGSSIPTWFHHAYGADGSVSTSAQFTSDSGTSSSHSAPAKRIESDLDNVMRTSPVVRFLSPAARQEDEEELRRVEQDREEREHQAEEIMDLEPVPIFNQRNEIASGDALGRTTSTEPL